MKRWIKSSTTRGTSYRVSGRKRELRNIVDAIYDEVETNGYIRWFANIKSAGPGYYIDYFRDESGWMLADRAEELADDVESVINDLSVSDSAHIIFLKNSVSSINDEAGGQCYIVRVVVKDNYIPDSSDQHAETTSLVD